MSSDPHVVALHYKLRHDETIDFSKAAPHEYETSDFKLRIENNHAVFTMKTHFGDVAEARAVVEELTRSWSIWLHLKENHHIDFVFDHPDIVNRADRPGSATLYPQPGRFQITGHPVTLRIGRRNYPPPPSGFNASSEVEAMHARYLRYKSGAEPLPSMAYWCLTQIQDCAGGRGKATALYFVDRAVLDCFGGLVSEKGGSEARKAKGASFPYSPMEREWINAALKLLICRLGEVAHNPSGTHLQITMADLPPLP